MTARQSDALTVEMPAVAADGFARAAWRYRWVLMLAVLLGSGAGAVVAARSSHSFAASCKLLFQQHLGTQQLPATAAEIQGHADQIASVPVLNKAAVALAKLKLKTFEASPDLFGTLKSNLKVNPGQEDGTITLWFSGPVASDNRLILNTVVATYRDYLAEQPNPRLQQTDMAASLPVEAPMISKSSTIAMGASVGLSLGVALSMCLYATDQRLRSPVEIGRLLRLPVIGVIPHLPGSPTLSTCALTSYTNPMSAFAEAARTVRSAIFFAGRSTAARTIVVTSTGKDDGTSSFASNLAIAMAQAGSLTLLLDANFRNARIAEIFGISPSVGLSEVVSGKSPMERAIARTAIERLEVLPCGIAPSTPAELLNSGGFSRLVEQLNQRYQCIILDSPPVSKAADARILSALADLTVFVVRAGSTRRNAADHALEQLLSVGARILGAVLNDVTLLKPIQRSRGILRWVEAPLEQPLRTAARTPTASSAFRSGAGSESSVSGPKNQRTESELMPEVEVVE